MIKFEFEDKIEAYCLGDRQWRREHRIAHAEYQRKIASSDDSRRFWKAIIKRNED